MCVNLSEATGQFLSRSSLPLTRARVGSSVVQIVAFFVKVSALNAAFNGHSNACSLVVVIPVIVSLDDIIISRDSAVLSDEKK